MAQGGSDLEDLLRTVFGGHGSGTGGRRGAAAGGTGAAAAGGPDGAGPGGAAGPGHTPPEPMASRLARWSRRALLVLGVVLVVVLAASYWWFHPALNLQSPAVWAWVIGIALVAALALRVAAARSKGRASAGVLRKLALVPLAAVLVLLGGAVVSQPFFPGNAERYAGVLGITDGDFAADIEEVDYSEVPVIDRESAMLLGNRAMGSIPEYVSQFEVADTYSQINYQGRPVRVSPLTYADPFKWWANRGEGIPAYVLVDMVTQEAQVVRLEQGIKYSESEPLARNIDRYAQLSYPGYMFDQKSFELDEEGTPWWVFPVQRRTIGLFGGTTIARVVLVNACTGETADYAVDECPEWVDRAYPADLIIEQYNWHGAYQGGWLNSWLGQQGVVRTSSGTDGNFGYNYLAQGEDVYLYSGVTSATADSSIVGFILVNQRTNEAHYYAVAGATEDSAMASAQGAVQDLRYEATYPLLLNVAGQPTYFMALKDEAGLVKMFAMINVEDYRSVATGSTVAGCQESYLALMRDAGRISDEAAEAAGVESDARGVVATLAQAVIGGNSHFYLTLEGDDAIYDVALTDGEALEAVLDVVRCQVGDTVTLTWRDGAAAGDDAAGAGVRTVTRVERELGPSGAEAGVDV